MTVPSTILSQTLSRTNFVEEYGRTVFERNGNKIGIEDFIPISVGRQEIENHQIKSSNKIIFCDTEDITTYLFSRMYFPDDYKSIDFINNSDYYKNGLLDLELSKKIGFRGNIVNKDYNLPLHWQEYYTQETADIVYKFCSEYFNTFEFEKDSWKKN